MYKGKLSERASINLGATYGFQTDLATTRDEIATTYQYLNSAFQEVTIDTIEVLNDSKGYLRLPKRFSYGAALELGVGSGSNGGTGRLVLSLQSSQTDWSNYQEVFDGDTLNDNLKNSNTYSFGVQYTPVVSQLKDAKLFQNIHYRAGFRYNTSYLSIDDQQINDYGISFGVGIPLLNTRSGSTLNMGFEYGNKGTTENDLIEEKYLGFFVGISLSPASYNRWFVKRRYD